MAKTFDRAAFNAPLALAGCGRLRIYYKMSQDLQVNAVRFNAEGQELLSALRSATNTVSLFLETGQTADGDSNVLIELAQHCSPGCSATSPP